MLAGDGGRVGGAGPRRPQKQNTSFAYPLGKPALNPLGIFRYPARSPASSLPDSGWDDGCVEALLAT